MFFVLMYAATAVFGQAGKVPDYSTGDYVIINTGDDTLNNRTKASVILRELGNGYVVIRLKKNQKSIDAYRKSGQNDIADRIEFERKKQNLKIFFSFTNNFTFCPVYFIYADETADLLAGRKGLFLNNNLEHDSTINPQGTNFVFCEYGIAQQFSDFDTEPGYSPVHQNESRKILDSIPTQKTTSPASFNGMFFSDKNLRQLSRPFPYVSDVIMDSYNRTALALSRELERAYQRLVASADFKEIRKKDRKKATQK